MAFKPSFNAEKGTVKILVRLSYFRGFQKSASVEGGALKYRTNGLMMKTTDDGKASIRVVKQALKHVIEQTWPGKDWEKFWKGLAEGRVGLFDGDSYTNDDGDVREHYEDTMYLRLTNDRLPKYKKRNGEDADEEERDDLFQSGYWAVAYFHFYTVKDKAKGGNGIFATLDALQFFKRDEVFSGGGISDDEIDDLGDDDDEDDLDEKPRNKASSKKKSSIDDDDDDL